MSCSASCCTPWACTLRSSSGRAPGASVPLTGFGSTLAKGVEKAVAEKGFLGAFTGGLTASAGGIAAAIFFGYLAAVLFKPKEKK